MTTSGPARGKGASQTAPPSGAENAPSDDAAGLQQQIEQTREQLGETVERLVAKTDLKARAKDKAASLVGQVKDQVRQVKTHAAARAGTARDQLASNTAGARQKAADLGSAAKEQALAGAAAAVPVWEAAPEPARQAVAKGAGATRQHRVPLAVVAGALIVGFLVIRWWRKQ
jgi:hypothetical protein